MSLRGGIDCDRFAQPVLAAEPRRRMRLRRANPPYTGRGEFSGHRLRLHRMPVAIEELMREITDATPLERVEDHVVLGFEMLELDDGLTNRFAARQTRVPSPLGALNQPVA